MRANWPDTVTRLRTQCTVAGWAPAGQRKMTGLHAETTTRHPGGWPSVGLQTIELPSNITLFLIRYPHTCSPQHQLKSAHFTSAAKVTLPLPQCPSSQRWQAFLACWAPVVLWALNPKAVNTGLLGTACFPRETSFLWATLSSYNSHTIQFTHVKVYNSMVSSIFTYATITTNQF